MIVDKNENVTLITQEKASIVELVKKIDSDYNRYKNDNIIVNLTTLDNISLPDLVEFLQLSNKHRRAKNSFVIVTDKTNLDETPDEIMVVPTLKEAYDIIEMEEIERDLGF